MSAIAIDGPAGAGKSTIAQRVAKELSFIYVDTGAMYRTMALYVLRKGIDYQKKADVEAACDEISIAITYEAGKQQVWLNGENVSGEIRREEVGNMASRISVYEKVRKKLVALQRQLAVQSDVVMDGRDIGTQVLPDAALKIYLTASVEERAKRRFLELQNKDVQADMQDIREDIRMRDERDMNRDISPLRKAEDAVFLDASDLTIEEVCQKVIGLWKKEQ